MAGDDDDHRFRCRAILRFLLCLRCAFAGMIFRCESKLVALVKLAIATNAKGFEQSIASPPCKHGPGTTDYDSNDPCPSRSSSAQVRLDYPGKRDR